MKRNARLLVLAGAVLLAMTATRATADMLPDPSNLMVCAAGTSASNLSNCTADPNHIGGSGFIVYYNSHGNLKPTIGDPFQVIVAVPIVNGVWTVPTVGATATWSAGTDKSVTANGQPVSGTFNSGDLYTFLYGSTVANNSWQFGNLQSCDQASNTCVNPLSASIGNVTGFKVFTWDINSNSPFFDATQYLTFTGNLPIGAFVTAYGVGLHNGDQVPVEVAFTNSGLVTSRVPEPASMLLLGTGLTSLGLLGRRKLRK